MPHFTREAVQTARKRLEAALEKMPEWAPDNSFFGDEPDGETAKYLKGYGIGQ